MDTEQPSRFRTSSNRLLLVGLALLILVGLGGAGYWGLHQSYLPPEAIALAERFLSLIKTGNLTEAYSLTTQDAMSGRTLEQFQSNVRHRVAVDLLAQKQTLEWRGVHGGFQTYGNRLRRWLAGRKIDPDIIGLDSTLEGSRWKSGSYRPQKASGESLIFRLMPGRGACTPPPTMAMGKAPDRFSW